ncbi:transposase, Mutator family protein [Mycobacterium xenopi 4042]|uniref:Mutator family transposase n=1 Tax=Mycobacterium xenopi 4042 TaxID=1299334 RepID=X8DUR2_MYCXE|nr:transposase, Mutator family protein [Mycobacterium xenopi 4042]
MGPAHPGRRAQRNGYRHRGLDTRVGTIDVAVPKLRKGTYFPDWLLERRKRAESALITVVADCYLAGVSTRRMDKLVKTLGIDSLSKSQVSRMATDLDEHVEAFRHRPLDSAGPFTFVAADALTMKVREGGRVVNGSCCWPLASTVTDTAKSWACGWSPARPARPGTSSSPTSSPAGWPAYAWSPATPTPGCARRSRPTCPERPGSGVAHTTRPT